MIDKSALKRTIKVLRESILGDLSLKNEFSISPFFARINAHLVTYGIAKAWTCQSLAKDVCKEQMPRCKFQSEMFEAVRAF